MRQSERKVKDVQRKISKILWEKSREGKLVPVSTIEKQFGSDKRVWSNVCRNMQNMVIERNGTVRGKRTRVWELKEGRL